MIPDSGAEDAVHDAVSRVAARWSGVENGRSYLYTAVVNAARDGARRESRAARLFERRRDGGNCSGTPFQLAAFDPRHRVFVWGGQAIPNG